MMKMDERKWRLSSSGIIVPKHSRPTAFDAFCGCGGMSLGIMKAGFEVLGAMDNDPNAALTYMCNLGSYPINIHYAEPDDHERINHVLEKGMKKNEIVRCPTSGSNFPNLRLGVPPVSHFFFGDIRKFDGETILRELGIEKGELDLVCGGPPCQGFSSAGKRDVMDPRNSLVFEFAKLVLELYPKTMVMENVLGIASMMTPDGVPVLDAFCMILESGGFGGFEALKKSLVNSSGAGAVISKGNRRRERGKAKARASQLSLLDVET